MVEETVLFISTEDMFFFFYTDRTREKKVRMYKATRDSRQKDQHEQDGAQYSFESPATHVRKGNAKQEQ